MPQLPPKAAVELAEGVYKLLEDPNGAIARLNAHGLFHLTRPQVAQGRTGVRGWEGFSDMGFAAEGVGAFKDDAFVVMRGTDLGRDWLTDGSLAASELNLNATHQGFKSAWDTIAPRVRAFFASRGRRYARIHCIGHSLGGALANLAALDVAPFGPPELYTFGAPRVGLIGLARAITSAVGSERIHRVAHIADPVPMVPLIPYVHAPVNGAVIQFGSDTVPIDPREHFIDHYVAAIGNASWAQLGVTRDQPYAARRPAQRLLEPLRKDLDRVPPGSVQALKTIAFAYDVVYEVEGTVTTTTVGVASLAAGTALDRLAVLDAELDKRQRQLERAAAQAGIAAGRQAGGAARAVGEEMGNALARYGEAEMLAAQAQVEMMQAAADAIHRWAGRTRLSVQVAANEAQRRAVRLAIQTVYRAAMAATANAH